LYAVLTFTATSTDWVISPITDLLIVESTSYPSDEAEKRRRLPRPHRNTPALTPGGFPTSRLGMLRRHGPPPGGDEKQAGERSSRFLLGGPARPEEFETFDESGISFLSRGPHANPRPPSADGSPKRLRRVPEPPPKVVSGTPSLWREEPPRRAATRPGGPQRLNG
jgi:hypothetical protein